MGKEREKRVMSLFFTLAAPAKINLHLHILSKRPSDGYHILDSLFVFTELGDDLYFKPSKDFSLEVTGDFAKNLSISEDNSIIKAALLLSKELGIKPSGEITLVKRLPISAGIGGGTADGAAALIGLQKLWKKEVSLKKLYEIGFKLGSDVVASLYGRPVLVGGVGDELKPAPKLPFMGILLVNPMVPISSREIFRSRKDHFSKEFSFLPEYKDVQSLSLALQKSRNDLTETAISFEPIIKEALSAIKDSKDCLLSRMSGSGSTCFGIYDTLEKAQFAEVTLKGKYPNWWIKSTILKS